MPAITTAGGREPNGAALAGGVVGGVVGLVVAIGGYFAWRRSWNSKAQPLSAKGFPGREHGFASLPAEQSLRFTENGRHGPLLDGASHPPLIPNCRPPSSLVSEPRTPAPLYTPRMGTHGDIGAGGLYEDVGIIGSGFSTPSDMTMSMSALMPTSPSTYLPSYATSLSTPPSYSPRAHSDGPRSPSAKQSSP
ncbi:hypothetical protein GSI_10978 [Ganoderma sinense ZZ0214-1]|uniref:Uncharacterized protein n=1 Tax=Ganoderma sinense ZZ0214-1 TaxID=1077348 RepID=A0A2G8S252_9APHY|nr:hypothetical protein GSI_10978 [Ganoderma sinense ZZ0214-1]